MPRATLLLLATLLALSGAGNVAAQSQTDVQVLDLNQIQSGTDNTQNLDIGNASEGGSSKVTINDVTQTQSGQDNKQTLNIGNARGGNTNVTLGTVKQIQSGSGGEQKMNIGNSGEIDNEAGSGNSSNTGQNSGVLNGSGVLGLNNNVSSRMKFFGPDNGAIDPVPPYLLGSCEYYEYRHNDFISRHQGGGVEPPSYYLDYGGKYCERFKNETCPKLTPTGQTWCIEVMHGLQARMEDMLLQPNGLMLELDEDAFNDFAYQTHVGAYWNEDGEVQLYELNTVDLVRIGTTPDFKDIFNKRGLETTIEVGVMLVVYDILHTDLGAARLQELRVNSPKIATIITEKVLKEVNAPDVIVDFFDRLSTKTPTINCEGWRILACAVVPPLPVLPFIFS
jgi:hypothetical protein